MRINSLTKHVHLDQRDPNFYNEPYRYYTTLREQAPIFYWEGYELWCFATHEDINAILRDRRFGRQILHLTTREALGLRPIRPDLQPFYDEERHSLLELEPPDHTRIRKLVQKGFMARQIERLRPRIAVLSHELIDALIERGHVDLLPHFATPIPVTIIAELIGIPTSMNSQLLNWSHAMVKMYELERSAENERTAVQATVDFVAYLREFVSYRRQKPQDDLLSHLIAVEEAGEKLSEDELISTCILLLNAGHEATVNVIGNGVLALLQQRDQLQRWRQDPALTQSAVEELLRFDTPLHLFTRWVLEDVTYKGQHFPFGTQVALLLGSANRDSSVFSEPERLDIGRKYNPHLSFGGGIHYCIGAPLARLELQVALPILFERLPNMTLAAPPEYANSYHFHGLTHLWVNLVH
jgi:cytochrome P450